MQSDSRCCDVRFIFLLSKDYIDSRHADQFKAVIMSASAHHYNPYFQLMNSSMSVDNFDEMYSTICIPLYGTDLHLKYILIIIII